MPIQIIEENRRPTFGENFGDVVNAGIKGFSQFQNLKNKKMQMQSENEALKRMGIDAEGIVDPKLREEIVSRKLQGQNERQKFGAESELETAGYNDIKNTFGEQFANIWKASPIGGKTELLKHAIDATERGYNIQEMLEEMSVPNQEKIKSKSINQEEETQKLPQMKNHQIPKDLKWPNYSKRPAGYTQKEFNDERKKWRAENVPIFEANNVKLDTVNSDILATKKLQSLNESKKLPEGLARLLINPETGELYGPAQLVGLASPEVQEWGKTIARFQNRAKDSFGSRVTNFDLVSYMKQFPGLLNTSEGRRRILRMMDINYDMDKLYNSSLKQVYQHYGLGNVPQEEADRLARGMIEDETEKLKVEYLGTDALNRESTLSGRMIDVTGPDGQTYEIDESEIDRLPEGYRIAGMQS